MGYSTLMKSGQRNDAHRREIQSIRGIRGTTDSAIRFGGGPAPVAGRGGSVCNPSNKCLTSTAEVSGTMSAEAPKP